MDLIRTMYEQMELKEVDASQYSPLALAYIGDNVYELLNRTLSVTRNDKQVNKLHKECSTRAKAASQAALYFVIEPILTEEELSVYKRGRNAQSYTKAKNAGTMEYRQATGLEALIGYLYLNHEYERLTFLLKTGWTELHLM